MKNTPRTIVEFDKEQVDLSNDSCIVVNQQIDDRMKKICEKSNHIIILDLSKHY